MTIQKTFMIGLLASSALGGSALAQQADNSGQTLGEVIVTATRQSSTIHNVPLSVTAVTPLQVERQGLKNAQDLVQAVTSLRISPANAGGTAGAIGNPDVAIRGIRGTSGAATTGIYVDDVPLQQRTLIGPAGGGTVFPNLFDLERVEVLKGPQGTLYGGSSEGGTIRFLTPQPDFNKLSVYARAEGSSIDQGGANYEAGMAVGGPIVQDKLAFRLSGLSRHDGGYIDHVSQYTGAVLPGGKDTNTADHKTVHGELSWKPTDKLTATFSYLYVDNTYKDSDQYWANFPAYSTYFGPAAPGTAPTGGKLYTFGPFNMFGPYKTGQNTNVGQNFYKSDSQLAPLLSPHKNKMTIPSLVLDYAFDKIDIKSITAYTETSNSSSPNFSYVDTASRSVTPLEGGFNTLPNNGPYIPTLPVYSSQFQQNSYIKATSEELRVSSTDPAAKLTWVAGFFYDYSIFNTNGVITANTGDLAAASIIGLPSATGTPFASLNGIGLVEPASGTELQLAGYGEATYKVTDSLRAIVGLRYTSDKFTYTVGQGGALFGFAPGVVNTIGNGSITENPVTPKFGLQYVVNPDLNFYFSAAKGFRPGGVNSAIPPSCAASLASAGYTSAPLTYASDSLWSYEVGAKARAFGKASFEASAFRIDWSNVQTTINLTCGQSFVTSAANAVSQGGDFQGSFLLFPGFTATVNVAYTDAHYTNAVANATAVLVAAGSEIPYTPNWQTVLTGEYRFDVFNKRSFVRADYSWSGAFVTGGGPGTSNYQPDAYRLPGSSIVNARAGMTFDKVEVSAFVTNLTGSIDKLQQNGFASGPGRVTCLNGPTCSSYQEYAVGNVISTFRPRTIGMAVSYRY